MSKKAYVSVQEIFPHSYLLTGSRHELEQGENALEGGTYNFLASILFTAFALEAYLNAVGSEKITCWEEIERYKKTEEKLRLLCKSENYKLSLGTPPFNSFKKIFELRNKIAHSKPMKISGKTVELDERNLPKLSKWMEECTLENATKYLDDASAMIEILHRELKVEGFGRFGAGTASWRVVDLDSNNE
jgi:hypothetical protein